MAEASPLLQWMFAALAVTLGAGFVFAIRTAWRRTGATAGATTRATLAAGAAAAVWMGATLAAAAAGALRFDTVPPTMVIVIALTLAVPVFVGSTTIGARLAAGLPLSVLVGTQSFRLPLELMMHRAATEGVMPPQMSYSGFNFDIVTGITAVLVAVAIAKGWAGRRAAALWNVLGAVLLLNVVIIALLSTPLPIRVFMNEPPNVWITRAPFIWLPTVMVFSAILGHIVVLRHLRMDAAAASPAKPAAAS